MLLTFSTVGNFFYFLMLMIPKIMENNIWPIWDELYPRPDL
jgi:hypothetical protein